MYCEPNSTNTIYDPEKVTVIDFRSDTFTKPTKKMREAIFRAEVGDDVFNEDPTVKVLQEKAAKMIGMEDAIFVCSGTMGNLISIMVHCDVRGSEAYCGDLAHCLLYEQAGSAQIAGVNLRTLKNNNNGTFDLQELELKLRRNRDHEPISKLVLVENTLNGKIVPQNWINELVLFCKKHNLKLHMDGARLWNASIASKIAAKDIVSGFDSVTFCLSKGLGAPVGSLLCGTKKFIENARRIRKVLGGGMRQVGILAAAGLVALEHIPNLANDHKRAFTLASAIHNIQSSVFLVDLTTVQTNMVFMEVDSNIVHAKKFSNCLQEFDNDDNNDKGVVVKCMVMNESLIRNQMIKKWAKANGGIEWNL